MATTESRKRKREADSPRVTFTTPERTFERLLKESSLGALRSTVIKKLGLDARTSLEFSQIRGAKSIDLEDEDDFEAFESYAASNGVAEVRVKILDAPSPRGHGSDSHEVPPTSLPGPEPSSLETSQVTPSLGIMSPVSQGHGASRLNNTAVAFLDRSSRVGSKQKEAQTREAASSVVAVSCERETLASTKKTRTHLSKTEHASEVRPNDGQEEKVTNDISQPDAASQERRPSNLGEEQGPAAVTKGAGGRKGKTDKEKRAKSKVAQTGPAVESVALPPTTAVPSPAPSVLIPPTTLVEAISESAPVVPLHEIKQKKSEKQRAPESSDLAGNASSRHEQSDEESPAISSSKKGKREGRSKKGHSEKSKSDSAPAQGNQKSRKRRLESAEKGSTEATLASKSNKSKKRKTDDANTSSAAAVHQEVETNNRPPPIAGTTSAPAPPKSSKAKKSKPTPEQILQYDEDLDSAVANVLAKRVSASSTQTASNAPVTAPASSLADTDKGKGLSKEHPVEVGAEDTFISKPDKRKSSKKQKYAEVLLAAPRTDGAEQVPHQGPTESKSISDADKGHGRVDQQTVQQRRSRYPSETIGILEASRKVASSVQSVAQKTSRHNDAATGKLGNATAGDKHESPRVHSPEEKSTSSAVKRGGITTNDSRSLTSPNFERARTAGIQSFAPSGSTMSEVISRRKGESSSSESDSISVFPDSDNDGRGISVTTPAAQKSEKDRYARDNTVTFFEPDSSFPTGDLNSFDIDSLLYPRSTQSWRDVFSSSKGDNNGEETQLMSDVDEDEDEEMVDRPRRGTLSKRRPSSSPSPYEDDENVSQGSPSGNSAFGEDSKADMSYSVSRENTTALNEFNLHTGTRTSRASSGQPREADEREAISTRSVVTVTGKDGQDKDDSHGNLQLPSLQDVNARGDSVATEGVADLAVNQAMEEDDTFFLTGLDKSTFTKHSVSSEQQLEHHDASSSSDPHIDSLEGRDFTSEISKKPEERNPSPVPPAPSSILTKSTSRPSSNGLSPSRTKLSLQVGVIGQEARPVSEGSRAGAAGTIDRMRGRNGKKAEPRQSLSQAPSSQPPLSRSRVSSPAIPSDAPEVSRSFATSTPTSEQHKRGSGAHFESATSEKHIGLQPPDLLSSRSARQRRNVAPTTTRTEGGKSTAKREGNFRAESEVTSSQSARNKKVKPSIIETKPYKSSAPESISLENSEAQEMPKSPSLSPDQTIATGRNISNINSGSSTEVERSVNGDKITADDLIPPPCTQPRGSGSPKQRVPSAASDTEDSSSDDDDGRPLMAQMLSNNSQASLAADRSLTNIANCRDLFSRTSTPWPSFATAPVKTLDSQMANVEANDKNDDDDDDSSSSSDSSSDDDHVSNIPEEKRAGHAASQSKSSRGFKSFLRFLA